MVVGFTLIANTAMGSASINPKIRDAKVHFVNIILRTIG
jgi:hypothetical protein